MATTGLHFWSTTAATNATADSSVNWQEGQAPSSVNDSARALMASAKKTYADLAGTLTTGGSSTAYTLTTNQVFADAAAMSGAILTFIPHTTSGATPTLAVDGLTARQIRTATGTNVATGALIAGTPYTVTYIHASTEFILHNGLGVFGALTVSSLAVTGESNFGGDAQPTTTDAGRLGDGTHQWGDLYLATGGLISWSNGDVLITHTSGTLTLNSTVLAGLGNITSAGAISGATAAGAMLASQAEQETGTATNKLVQPGVQHFHPSAAKAWGRFAGATGAATSSYNCTTARGGVGEYTVTITNDFSGTTYTPVVSLIDATDVGFAIVTGVAAGSFTIETYGLSGTNFDADEICFTCFGDL